MMKLTHNLIDQFRFLGRLDIDDKLEAELLRRFGKEPHPHGYSEQDLYAQVRKYIMNYNQAKEVVSVAR
jgi:hypothetical protein